MKYRVEIDISFADEQDAIDILNYIEDRKAKAYKKEGTKPDFPMGMICRYHPCTHDETTPGTCTGYVDVNFEAPKKIHRSK
jgi:hypothetical protein